jgi:helix-turn-helix protein
MSVNLMSAIFETEFRDLQDGKGNTTKAATAKLVLLAMADHANDEGEGAYPSIERLCRKTALSPQTIRNTFDALRYNGIIQLAGISKHGTNNHTINTKSFPKSIGKDHPVLTLYPLEGSNEYHDPSNGSLLPLYPLDPNHQVNINNHGDESPLKTDELPIEWQIAAGVESVTAQDKTRALRWDVAQLIGMGEKSGAVELAMAFMDARDITIPESKIKGQRKAIREMLEMMVKPEHITEAVRQLLEKKMTIIDLFSVSKTAQDLANKPQEKIEYTRLL